MYILPLVVLAAYILAMPLVAFLSARMARERADRLEREVTRLSRLLNDIEERIGTRDGGVPKAEVSPQPEAATALDEAARAEEGPGEEAASPVTEEAPPIPAARAAAANIPADNAAEAPYPAAAAGPGPWGAEAEARTGAPAPSRSGMEETLTSQWMIWIGAITIALSAVFLFRYAIDEGWLTPIARVVAGLVLGGMLLAAGEWTERRPVRQLSRTLNPDYVPPALTASGLFAIFAALYAAHALYALMGPASAFVALGLVCYSALGLALRQGWFVALMGLAGGYLVPALIESPETQALPLFLYLWLLSAGCLALMAWRHWWWFAALTLAGALLWPLLWMQGAWSMADQGVLGSYGVGLAALFAGLSTRLPVKEPQTPLWRWMSAMLADTSGLGFTLCGLLLLLLADLCNFNAAAFLFLALYGAVALAMGAWRQTLESLAVASALIVLLGFLLWPAPVEITPPARLQELGTASGANSFGPFVMPPEFLVFSRALWVFAALFGIGGHLALPRGRTAALWAGLSAFMPVVLFAIGYWRIGAFEIDISWAAFGMGLAAVLLLAAISVARRMDGDRRNVILALYAAGCTAAIALAFTCLLREGWLTVALSVEILALAWIWDRIRVDEVKAVAAVMAGVVLVRLVANPALLDYEGEIAGLFGWVIYGYGLPAAAAAGAARLFARGAGGHRAAVVIFCEILAAGFAFLMVAFQLKLWTSGTIRPEGWTLFDSAVQSVWWIVAAAFCLRRDITRDRPWMRYAGGLILLAAALLVGLGQVIENNPLVTGEQVGRLPLINLLGLAYLLPALGFAMLGYRPAFDLPENARKALLSVAGLLLIVFVTLETRRAFWGSGLGVFPDGQPHGLRPFEYPGNSELYAYSVVWIAFALVLLALGIWRASQEMRYASLAVLIVTVIKVFLYDMSDLAGLYRVASFLGLGLTLIGIGRVYRRFVFTQGSVSDQRGDE